jgi:hypothetical protein
MALKTVRPSSSLQAERILSSILIAFPRVLEPLIKSEVDGESIKIAKYSHVLDHTGSCVSLLDASMSYLNDPGLILEEQPEDRISLVMKGLLTFSTVVYLAKSEDIRGLACPCPSALP